MRRSCDGRILIVVEASKGGISPTIRCVIAAALKLNRDIDVLVMGEQAASAAAAAAVLPGVAKILYADSPSYAQGHAEAAADLVSSLSAGYAYVLTAATSFGKDVLPRFAALKTMAMLSEVRTIDGEGRFVRPLYAGRALATVESCDPVVIMTICTAAFAPVSGFRRPVPIENALPPGNIDPPTRSWLLGGTVSSSCGADLATARVIVAVGRGIGAAESIGLAEALARRLGGVVAATQAVVDAGYLAADRQVGQTGKTVAPDLYFAVGVSGAVQHAAGMKDSRVIVAINKDREAPIFRLADYGLVGDLFEVVPALIAALDRRAAFLRRQDGEERNSEKKTPDDSQPME